MKSKTAVKTVPDEVLEVYFCAIDSKVPVDRAVLTAARYWARESVKVKGKRARWCVPGLPLENTAHVLCAERGPALVRFVDLPNGSFKVESTIELTPAEREATTPAEAPLKLKAFPGQPARPVRTFRVTDRDGKPVKQGDTLIDFRGDSAIFDRVVRGPVESDGRSCKVTTVGGSLRNHNVFGLMIEELDAAGNVLAITRKED